MRLSVSGAPSSPRFPAAGRHVGVPTVRLLAVAALLVCCWPGRPAQAQAPRGAATHPGNFQSLQAELGLQLFFDKTLSDPEGQSCASCHAPAAGFRFPDSQVNADFGVAPGAVDGRFTNRSVPTISYAQFIPKGPPSAHLLPSAKLQSLSELLFIGGVFWDGRATDLEDQATFPFQNPNEMNNLIHNVGSPERVVRKLMNGEHANLFRRVYGPDAFRERNAVIFANICAAIAAYERGPEVSPFTSKYDAWLLGLAQLTPEEFDGLRLMTGTSNGFPSGEPYHKDAHCIICHGIENSLTDGPSFWTFSCYTNIGTPKNENNPFYTQTDSASNPAGFNPAGAAYIDLGLGGFLYPLNDLPPGNMGAGSNGLGDFFVINGAFKVPTLRNVDKRPSPEFVKPYMHNGVFKSLKEVVHFYNTRNLTTVPGEVIDFTDHDPYASLLGTPLWPVPEVSSAQSLINPSGLTAAEGGELGNLGLTEAEEDHIVAFMQTLSDGFFTR